MKERIKRVPIVGSIARTIYRKWIRPHSAFDGSESYWIQRYESGGTSGDGSYDRLAEFKAQVVNDFVRERKVETVIEYGCGDGNQLNLARYPSYKGFDVSPRAVSMCRETFDGDATRAFEMMDAYDGEAADLTLSLDVIYHLIEDDVFGDYLNRLFDSSTRFVIIYSSDTDQNSVNQAAHVRHRKFTKWVGENKPGWELAEIIPNKYPLTGDTKLTSFAEFFVYQKVEKDA